MDNVESFIRLTIETEDPIAISDFSKTFTSIGSVYGRSAGRDILGVERTNLFIKEVRRGSIEADLIPIVFGTTVVSAAAVGIVGGLNAANVLHDFVQRYGGTLLKFLKGEKTPDTSPSDISAVIDQVTAIANTPGSRLKIASVRSLKGDEEVTAHFEFTSSDARFILTNAQAEMDRIDLMSRPQKNAVSNYINHDIALDYSELLLAVELLSVPEKRSEIKKRLKNIFDDKRKSRSKMAFELVATIAWLTSESPS